MANYRSYQNVIDIITSNIYKLDKDIDLIVGVTRSGIIPASIIGLLLNKAITDIDSYIAGRIWSNGIMRAKESIIWENIKNVLIIDDSVNSGKSLNIVKEKISKNNILKDHNIIYGCVFLAPGKEEEVDLYFEILPPPRYFEWNVIHHPDLQRACLDIDGIICHDPTEEENDDGPKYIEFLKNAKPLYIPTVPVSCFVTSRLEKYRKYTEDWLKKYNIKYSELLMLNLPSKKERLKQNAHGKFKADVYRNRKENLFIESNEKQAEEIFNLTGKAVITLNSNRSFSLSSAENEKKYIEKYQRIIDSQDKEIHRLRSSVTYKIGRIITYLPIRIKDIIKKKIILSLFHKLLIRKK